MFHIHGVWTRTTGIGLFVFIFYFIHSFLFFLSLCANQTIYLTLPYYFGMFHFLVWFGFGFGFSLVSMLVWSRSRWTVRVGGGLAGVLRERVHRDKVWIGWVFRFL